MIKGSSALETSGNIGTRRTQVGQVCPEYVNHIIHARERCTFEYGIEITAFIQKKAR
jgi:hypothetical protein